MSDERSVEVEVHSYQTRDPNITIRFNKRPLSDRRGRGWDKKTRVYGALDALVPELLEVEPHTDKAIPFKIVDTDFDSEEDYQAMVTAKKEYDSWRRKTTKVAKERMIPLLLEAMKDPGIQNYDRVDAEFSRTAGCSCPCSPGFVLDLRIMTAAWIPTDIWIDLTSELQEGRQKAADRKAAKEKEEEEKKLRAAIFVLENAGYEITAPEDIVAVAQ